ncbi:MAG: hypothetical protein P1Q69_00655 [Candidatus Thorarchaeota archaeon]|nr:hypothetical protein [Candidatus Thorarchaeota archaeon]
MSIRDWFDDAKNQIRENKIACEPTPYTSGDYYVSWSLLQGYVQMKVKVQAYDTQGHYLGSDETYVTLPGTGGGGSGGDPLPE